MNGIGIEYAIKTSRRLENFITKCNRVVRTASTDGQLSVLQHPMRGNVSCASICPPQKAGGNDIIFCRDNCPDYWNWMISVIFASPSTAENRTSDCTVYNFTHVPSNKLILCSSFRNLTNDTERVKKFWSRNCISYFICVIWKNIDVLTSTSVSAVTSSSAESTAIPFQPTEHFSLSRSHTAFVAFVTLVFAISVGLIALIIYICKRRKPGQLVNDPQSNVEEPLNPTATEASTHEDSCVIPPAPLRFPIQVEGSCSHITDVSTTPKEVYESGRLIGSLQLEGEYEETQYYPLDDLSSHGPRAVTPTDRSFHERNNSFQSSCNGER